MGICGADAAEQRQRVIDVIEHFRKVAGTFLTSKDQDLKSDSIIDITHESLIERWTTLKGWVNEEEKSAKLYCDYWMMHRIGETALEGC